MQFILFVALILIAFLILFIVLLLSFMAIDFFLELPFVRTQKGRIETIMQFAKINKGETVVDLGSGDGRLLIEAARRGAHAIGYEINPFLIALSLLHIKLEGLGNQIWIQKENLWKADLAVADVIFVYALKKTMPKMEAFIFKNAQKGTRVVVNTNIFPTKKELKSENGIFLYKV